MVYQLVFANFITALVIAVSYYFQNRISFLTYHSNYTTVAIIHTVAWQSQIVLGSALAIAVLRIQYHITFDLDSIAVTSVVSDTAGINLLVVAIAIAAVAGITVMEFGCCLARTWGWAGILPFSLTQLAIKLLKICLNFTEGAGLEKMGHLLNFMRV